MIGLDSHTTGAEVVARLLRDAGMEVIYLGVNQTAEMIVAAALQEDANVIGISSHAANYAQIIEVVELLKRNGADDVLVICGGNIPKQTTQELKAHGIAEVFPPGSSGNAMISFLIENVRAD